MAEISEIISSQSLIMARCDLMYLTNHIAKHYIMKVEHINLNIQECKSTISHGRFRELLAYINLASHCRNK